ncbi:hypothetical protein HDV64DRAFT_128969 [Trichoderma sp. TUCIM 5745]
MDNVTAIASGSPDVTYEDNDLSTTQPFSSPGSAASSEDIKCNQDDWINCNPNANSTDGGNNKTAIITDENKTNKNPALIQGSYDIFKIVWKDANGAQRVWKDVNAEKQLKETEHVKFEMKMDTSANTAMFAISTSIILKSSRRKSQKQPIYLNMPPEWISTITTKTSNRRSTASDSAIIKDHALRFTLTQGAEFVGPQDCQTDSTRLALFQSLAIATELTCHLAGSDKVLRNQKDFRRLATIFSFRNTKNRPRKDEQCGNAATLHAGEEGMIVSVDEGLVCAEKNAGGFPMNTNDLIPKISLQKKKANDPISMRIPFTS